MRYSAWRKKHLLSSAGAGMVSRGQGTRQDVLDKRNSMGSRSGDVQGISYEWLPEIPSYIDLNK